MKDDRFVWRVRLIVCSLALLAVAMVQQPGRIVSDTKLDLVVAPSEFLGRATSLWDAIGYFGQVQNQAYGYLFPMGPFFLAGNGLGIEPWVIQRLWWALLLITAFLGFVLLARELRIGSQWAQLAGGFAFALSPRILSVIGPSSIEVWPMALAPWVLLALVIGSSRRSPVAMAALSAVAVAMAGGVNAVATFAVIPLGALWLLMSPPSPRRRRMMIAWPGFVLLGTLWWIVPLLILGRYSPPFLDFIETASLTSFDTTLIDALRGTSNWTSYLSDTAVAGRNLVSEPVLLLNLAVVLALSVVGLARRDLPHRRFLFVGVMVGLALVTLGHTASHGGLGAGQLQGLLDGALSPLRNTHKFDVLIRLPLTLSFVHLLTVVSRRESTDGARVGLARLGPGFGVAVLAVVGLVGVTSPAWSGQIAPKGSFTDVPDYWQQSADWLAEYGDDERALVLPASSFASYLWGYTNDDVMQPLAASPWGVRNAIPLAPGGNIEMLDSVEREIADGRGSAGLQDYLLGSGVSLLVVRNDLEGSVDGLDPELVRTTVAGMPSAQRVAAFGPTVGGKPTIQRRESRFFIDQGWQGEHPAVEIFRIGRGQSIRSQPTDEVPVVVGSADSHVGLLESGMVKSPSVVYAPDLAAREVPEDFVLTDGRRRQEVAFGRAHENRSASLGPQDQFSADRPVHQYVGNDSSRWSTVPDLQGAKKISASSSKSAVGTPGPIDIGRQPWAAFDGDTLTSWRASAVDIGERSWLRIAFDGPTDVSDLKITVGGDPVDTRRITVRTDSQSVVQDVRRGRSSAVTGLQDQTRELTISAPSTAEDLLEIVEVSIPGTSVSRPLRLPTVPSAWPSPRSIMLEASTEYRSGCLLVSAYLRCASGKDSWGEDGRVIDRVVPMPRAETYPMKLTVEPIGGRALDRLLQDGQLVTVAASSQTVRAAQASAVNAIDGLEASAWIAAKTDKRPRLTVSWVGERSVSSLVTRLNSRAAASRPTAATLRFSDGTRRDVVFDETGLARFPETTADRVEIEFTSVARERNLSTAGGAQELAVGVSEVRIPGTTLLPVSPSGAVRTFDCGTGPTITAGGKQVRTRLVGRPTTLLSGAQLSARICGDRDLDLGSGDQRITVKGTGVVRPVRLALGETATAPNSAAVEVKSWGAEQRNAKIVGGRGDQTLAVTENTNPGWEMANRGAKPVVLNGWQQGWNLPAGSTKVDLSYSVNRLYQAALVTGGLLLMTLFAAAAWLSRRRPASEGEPAPRSRRRGLVAHALAGGFVGASALLLGGFTGLACGALGFGLAVLARRWVEPGWIAGALVALVAASGALRPWGGASTWLGAMDWPQLVIAVALGSLSAAVFGPTKPRSRSAGTSIQA